MADTVTSSIEWSVTPTLLSLSMLLSYWALKKSFCLSSGIPNSTSTSALMFSMVSASSTSSEAKRMLSVTVILILLKLFQMCLLLMTNSYPHLHYTILHYIKLYHIITYHTRQSVYLYRSLSNLSMYYTILQTHIFVMEAELQAIYKAVSSIHRGKSMPELLITPDGLATLVKHFGERIVEMDKMHATYKSESEEYMQILLEEIRVRTRQLEESKSKSEDSVLSHSKLASVDDIHRISYDDYSCSQALLDWADIVQVLE